MAAPLGAGRTLWTASCLGSTGTRTAPPGPPVRPLTEASALIVPAAADLVRRRGAGARPDGVFSGAPWHRPARPPGVIPLHDGTVERQHGVMSVAVGADDPSRERTSMRCPPAARPSTPLGGRPMRHRPAQGRGPRCVRPRRRAQRPQRHRGRSRDVCTTGVERRARGSGSSAVRRRTGRRPGTARSPWAGVTGRRRRPEQHPDTRRRL